MQSTRQLKVAGLIQQDLADIFQKDSADWVGSNVLVTVTRVEVSPDLGVAKVHLSFLLQKNGEELLERIEEKNGLIRKKLGNKIGKQVRIIPELRFFLDETAEYAQRMDKIISDLNIPKEDDDKKDD
ncbi:MAG: 30S ribosome-binding factor RbfA [Cyclobacteriaceae bacterium]|nr:30S ribosome-binding factor RbfA [Cyclobacteriaceae bacterium]MCH8515332.1 30S ribosome-binding factor RbfA [Cyclobacteriaceae bacterium]